jgi:hypothetical protein
MGLLDQEAQLDYRGRTSEEGSRWDLFKADAVAGFYNDGLYGKFQSTSDAYGYFGEKFKAITGDAYDWSNPMISTWDYEGTLSENVDRWNKNVEKAKIEFPSHADMFSRKLEDKAAGIRRQTQLEAEEEWRNAPPGFWSGASRFGGQMVGFVADPVNAGVTIATAPVGGMAGAGAIGLVKNALLLAAVNGGAEIAQLPFVERFRQETSLANAEIDPAWGELSEQEMAMRVGSAALFTGVGDLAIRGGYRAIMKYKGQVPLRNSKGRVYGYTDKDKFEVRPIPDGEGGMVEVAIARGGAVSRTMKEIDEAPDSLDPTEVIREKIKEVGGDTDEGLQSISDVFEAHHETWRLVDAHNKDIEARSQVDALYDAEAYVGAPDRNLPPPPMEAKTRAAPKDQPNLSDNPRGIQTPEGMKFMDRGKPVYTRVTKLQDAETNSSIFQFKRNVDAAGSTGKMDRVSTWSDAAAGRPILYEWEDPSRALTVADSHQRHSLAKRLSEEGSPPESVVAIVYREADGWTPSEVRAVAAKRNLQEGSADAIDAARILREHPELLDDSIPLSDEKMRQAVHLTRLSDEAFDLVVSGQVKTNHAALIGKYLRGKPERHASVLRELTQAKPANEAEARIMINEMTREENFVEKQYDMLGERSVSEEIWRDRANLIVAARAAMVKHKKIYGLLTREVDVIERAGNKIDRIATKSKEEKAGNVAEIFEKVARSRGPIGDQITALAREVKQKKKTLSQAVNELQDEVSETLETDGLQGLLSKHTLPPPDKMHADVDANVEEIGDGLQRALWGNEGPPQPPIKVKPKESAEGKAKAEAEAPKEKTAKEKEDELYLNEEAQMRESIEKLKESRQYQAAEDMEQSLTFKKLAKVARDCDK